MPISSYASEIRKTGFVLENEAAQMLKAAGWSVISNKHYIDDSEETVREIDLVAYRVNKVQHFEVYTVIIISCKKSESNAWALLSRDANGKDPNADWWPLHAWTNDKAISYQIGLAGKNRDYHSLALSHGVIEVFKEPKIEVFAFQEMDKNSGKPQNDKAIFSAVTSLMKAQAYELGALPARKKALSVYQFNLLSLVDTDLVRLHFEGREIRSSDIQSEDYLARYIIQKREIFARIKFLKSSALENALEDYLRLHNANCRWFQSECDAFYKDVFTDWRRIGVFVDDFKRKIDFGVRWHIQQKLNLIVDLGLPGFALRDDGALRVGFALSENVLEFMDQDEKIRSLIAAALKQVFRYEGTFHIEFDMPF